MARTRRRPRPAQLRQEFLDSKYGLRGNAKGKSHSGSRGQSQAKNQKPNRPRKQD